MTTLAQAIDQMLAAGMPDFPPDHPRVSTDRIVRYGPKGRGWYRLYEHRARNSEYYVSGAYGLHGGPGALGERRGLRIESDYRGMDPDERERLQRSQAELEAREKTKSAERARFAANRARSQWHDARSAKPDNVQTYLDRKDVEPERGLRWLADGTLLVPAIRYNVKDDQEADPNHAGPRRLVGLQKISPDGTKRFNKGMAKLGAACRLGKAPKASGEPILMTEGIATGLSIRMAINRQHPVFVAFDAGNLLPVAKILRTLYPLSPILLCADDDAYLASSLNKLLRENYGVAELVTPPLAETSLSGRGSKISVSAQFAEDGDGVPGIVGAVHQDERLITIARENAGRKYANQAAAEVGNAAVVFPVFADRPLPADPDVAKLTDFNDLHQAEGLDAVLEQLAAEIERLKLSSEVRRLVREESGKSKRGAKGDPKPGEPNPAIDWSAFFRRYTLIYPTDTLWDAEQSRIVKLSAVKIAYGDRAVEYWLRSPDRKMVNQDQLVFEPDGKCGAGCINLFRGISIKPVRDGPCEQLLKLLQYLCGEADQDQAPVTDWVLKWLAYPLQRPGAKMQTAVVMHGAEGTGKNLFFGAIREIYGEYASLITQTELEDRFNGWLSRRLFLIANEVISRQELRHHVGRLKNYVTESPLPIREMFMPIRYEANHAQIVFLTNELQALQISPGDRRYMVIRTPGAESAKFYSAVAAELAAGGAAALYAYLLDYPLGDFAEHTKPLVTDAKLALIEQGLNSAQHFQIELKEERLGLPYGPCFTKDLYQAYRHWCEAAGQRNPMPLNRFSHEFMAMNGVRRLDRERMPDPDKPMEHTLSRDKVPRRSVMVMGDKPNVENEQLWLAGRVKEWRAALREFLKPGITSLDRGRGTPSWWEGNDAQA